MGNEFSNIAYGCTEVAASEALASTIIALYPKVRHITPVMPTEKELSAPEFFIVYPYGRYEVIYRLANSQFSASILFVDSKIN